MLKKIRQKIEQQRNSKKVFWRILVSIKDLLWKIWAMAIERIIRLGRVKKKARKNLQDIAVILNEVNAHWWLEAGTCLGAIREKDFIAHDNDIDIGLFGLEKIDIICEKLIQKGFRLNGTSGLKENSFQFSLARYNIPCDFYCFYEDKDTFTHSAWFKGKQFLFTYPSYLFKDLKKIEFLGITVNVPNPPEKHLALRYGKRWQIPDKTWDWYQD